MKYLTVFLLTLFLCNLPCEYFALPVTMVGDFIGVDVSQPVSESEWKCLQSPGNQGPVSFAIVRVYRSTGEVDPNGANTIRAAKQAGIRHVDGYIFPCVQTSSPSNGCPSPEAQVNETVRALESAGVRSSVGMLWYDIEPYSWSKDLNANTIFLKRMIEAGKRLNVKAGIYSNWNSWAEIMGKDWSYPKSQGLQLWYPHYDGLKSFSDFQSFGGWDTPSM
eukprot:g2110.t1